jgi:predicted transcriptional regulator
MGARVMTLVSISMGSSSSLEERTSFRIVLSLKWSEGDNYYSSIRFTSSSSLMTKCFYSS